MQNDQTYSDLTNSIATVDDLLEFQGEIDLLEKSFYEPSLKPKVSQKIASVIKSKEDLDKLKLELSKIKTLEITLSENPSLNLIEKISTWTKEMHQKIALDIKIDPTLLGGATLSFNGKYFDGSLRLILTNVMQKYI